MLELFILESCPYCKKVMTYMNENKIPYRKIDISNKESEESLIQIGGKRQVPFLIDTDRNIQMYESDDIIEYAKTLKWKQAPQRSACHLKGHLLIYRLWIIRASSTQFVAVG